MSEYVWWPIATFFVAFVIMNCILCACVRFRSRQIMAGRIHVTVPTPPPPYMEEMGRQAPHRARVRTYVQVRVQPEVRPEARPVVQPEARPTAPPYQPPRRPPVYTTQLSDPPPYTPTALPPNLPSSPQVYFIPLEEQGVSRTLQK